MRIITKRSLIRDVANAWGKQYATYFGKDDKQEKYRKLVALDKETATPEEVDAIIGNGSWTRLVCENCRKEVSTVIEVGEEPDYESRTVYLCKKCLLEAVSLMMESV